jgi:hypothetical protein
MGAGKRTRSRLASLGSTSREADIRRVEVEWRLKSFEESFLAGPCPAPVNPLERRLLNHSTQVDQNASTAKKRVGDIVQHEGPFGVRSFGASVGFYRASRSGVTEDSKGDQHSGHSRPVRGTTGHARRATHSDCRNPSPDPEVQPERVIDRETSAFFSSAKGASTSSALSPRSAEYARA